MAENKSWSFTLKDDATGRHIRGRAELSHGVLMLHFRGYSQAGVYRKDAYPVAVETYNDELQVLVWPDPRDESPRVIKLERLRVDMPGTPQEWFPEPPE